LVHPALWHFHAYPPSTRLTLKLLSRLCFRVGVQTGQTNFPGLTA
jgi:hypothetical protein